MQNLADEIWSPVVDVTATVRDGEIYYLNKGIVSTMFSNVIHNIS